jgi:hypothetical protein
MSSFSGEFALSDVRAPAYAIYPHPKIPLDTNGVERALPILSTDHRAPRREAPHQ